MRHHDFIYNQTIDASLIDGMGHVNHAQYLVLFEQARWDICIQKGMTAERMKEEGMGLVVLEAHIQYRKELMVGDKIEIRTQLRDLDRKVWTIHQSMHREAGETCSTLELKGALFDLKQRRMILANAEWRQIFIPTQEET